MKGFWVDLIENRKNHVFGLLDLEMYWLIQCCWQPLNHETGCLESSTVSASYIDISLCNVLHVPSLLSSREIKPLTLIWGTIIHISRQTASRDRLKLSAHIHVCEINYTYLNVFVCILNSMKSLFFQHYMIWYNCVLQYSDCLRPAEEETPLITHKCVYKHAAVFHFACWADRSTACYQTRNLCSSRCLMLGLHIVQAGGIGGTW